MSLSLPVRRAAAVASTAMGGVLAGVALVVSSKPEPRHEARQKSARPAPTRPASPAPPPRSQGRSLGRRESRALGTPTAGSLVRGVLLPGAGAHFRTWDPILRRSPNRAWRRYATDDLVRAVLRVARRYATAEPGALPVLVGDLSRPRGGDFGQRYGIIGHSSHQNGLDVDVYYPRRDRRADVPQTPAQVDPSLAQRLVDLFVAAGAQTVLVGPNLSLEGPAGIVTPYPGHDNHLHVRIANPA